MENEKDILNEEEIEEEVEEEETEEDVKEELKQFIQDETKTSLEKEVDATAEKLINKFFDGVAAQRAKAIQTGKKPAKANDEQVVRKWFGALMNKDHQTLRSIEKDYLQYTNNDQGGYLVPPALLAEVNRWTETYGIARRDMRYLPFNGPGNERKIPRLASSVAVYWLDEAAGKPSTKPTFELVTQTLKKMAAIVPMTEEILEDSAINLIQLLGELFGEAIAKEEDRVFLAGQTAGDPYNGILYAAGTVTVTQHTAKKADDADDIVEKMNRMIYAIPASARPGAKFYMHSTIFSGIQRIKDTDGHYIVQHPVNGAPGRIWEYPYELVDILPDSTTAVGNNKFMFFGNLGRTCVYGDKAGLRVKMLDQAIVSSAEQTPSDLNLATQDMVALRIVKRVGYVPLLPSGVAVLRTAA